MNTINSQKVILLLGIIFILVAPLYSLGYISLNSISIFGFSLGALSMSISSLLDNPLKRDSEQHLLRKIIKGFFFYLSIVLVILSLMIKPGIPIIEKIINSIDSNVFLLYSIGFSFLTLHISDIYKTKFQTKVESEKNKAVAKALNKYDKVLKEKFNDENR